MAILLRMETALDYSLTLTLIKLVRRISPWFALTWLALSFSALLHAEPVAIVHPSTPHTALERKSLRAAFGMTLQTWPNGQPLTVFVFRDDAVLHQQFCRKVLGVLPYTLRRNWDRLLFSGAAQAPITVQTSQEMLYRVATTPGAIGYIEKESHNASVSIIEVID
jgi:hypothetical protein